VKSKPTVTALGVEQRPRIADGEYDLRLKQVKTLMEQMEVDLLFAYADDRAVFGPAHLRWLFDYYPHFEPACALIPRRGEPVIVTGAESISYIRTSSRFKGEVLAISEFVHADEEYPFAKVCSLGDIVRRMAKDDARVGLAGTNLMEQQLYRTIVSLFPQGVRDVNSQVEALRAVKSQAEIEVIRYAYGVAEAGTLAAISAISAGATEREIAAEAEYVMRRLGAEGTGIDTIVASGPLHTYPILHRTTQRRVREGDSIVLTIAPRYEGYHAAIGRTLLLGDVDPVIRRARQTAADALEETSKLLRPGARAEEIDATARAVVAAGGFGENFLYSGSHSVGVIEFEPPILSSFAGTTLQADMIFSIDIPMFHCPWGGLRIEEGFRVTPAEPERLQAIALLVDL